MGTNIKRTGRAGFSMIETLIAATVLAMAVGTIVLVSNANNNAYQTGATVAELESKAGIAMGRLVEELRMVGKESLSLTPTQLQYERAEGFVAGQKLWSTSRRLELALEGGELDDGVDNNGNGLIDERQVVLTEDVGGPNERRRVLVRWVSELAAGELPNGVDDNGDGQVDEAGFTAERVGDALVIRLSLQRLDAQGFPITRAAQTSTSMRN